MTSKNVLDLKALQDACRSVARETLWQTPKPDTISDIIDSDQIKRTVSAYFSHAKEMSEFIVSSGGDPNFVTRAVHYLAHTHAIPPMKEDVAWFNDMLDLLIELAYPNVISKTPERLRFLSEMRDAIEARLPKPRKKAPNKAL